MYTPAHFHIDDAETLTAFMRRHSFATVVTHDGSAPHGMHMPVIYRPSENGGKGVLVTHLARANPQWRHFENGEEVLVMFTGPHAYISPAWYATSPAVPTWNYTAVHVYGRPRIMTSHEHFASMLGELVDFHEAARAKRWHGVIPTGFRDQLMKAIVGVEIEISRIEGKFKLNQNRPDDVAGVIAALSESEDQTERELADLMRAHSI